jgi:hypothetical protein
MGEWINAVDGWVQPHPGIEPGSQDYESPAANPKKEIESPHADQSHTSN